MDAAALRAETSQFRVHHVPVAQEYVASRAALRTSTLAPMPLIPRATRWLKMADDACAMADHMHDPDSKRMMLDIADSYERLAAWASNTDAVDTGKPD